MKRSKFFLFCSLSICLIGQTACFFGKKTTASLDTVSGNNPTNSNNGRNTPVVILDTLTSGEGQRVVINRATKKIIETLPPVAEKPKDPVVIKPVEKPKDPVVIKPVEKPADPIVIKPTEKPNNPSTPTRPQLAENMPAGSIKSDYYVSYILPFRTELAIETTDVPKESRMAVYFYEGVQLALRDLENEGMSLHVRVYDSKKDIGSIREVLQKPEIAESDMIIGPVYSSGLREVADYAKKNHKILVSPVNPADDITTNNPYYLQTAPTLQTHAEAMIKSIYTKFGTGANIVLVCKNETAEIANFKYFQDAYYAYKGSKSVPPLKEIKASTTDFSALNGLNTSKTVVIAVTWQDEAFIRLLCSNLSTYKLDAVYGMEPWLDMDINPEHLEEMNFHTTAENFIDPADYNTSSFKKRYFYEYGMSPTDYAYRGYSTTLYFGRMLKRYGTGFMANFSPESVFNTKFDFQAVYRNQGALDGATIQETIIERFENKYVHVLEYEKFRLKKVN